MTNKESISALIGFAPSNANVIELALLNAGYSPVLAYDTANQLGIKKAAIQVLYVLLSTADTNQGNSETVNSIKYDRAAILKRIEALENETGATDAVPVITSFKAW